MPFCGQIWYEDIGSGKPVLFVHGWCMSSAVWQMQQTAVAEQYRFIAIDLQGHGRSALPVEGVKGFAGYAAGVISLVEELDLSGLVLVGWSLGAQVLLTAYPYLQERIAGQVLVGATPRFSAAPHFPFGLLPKEAAGMRLKVRRNFERALEGFHQSLFVLHELNDPVTACRVAQVLAHVVPPSSVAALEGLEALMDEEVMMQAGMVSVPTLLLHGDQDRVCLPSASVWFEQAIPGSQRIVFSGCGHAPFLSRPLQFNQQLLAFLGRLHGTD